MRDDQVQRFSRQILLKELGGVGQARLLSTSIRVIGAGEPLDVAAAYLIAGGSAVLLDRASPATGFLAGYPMDSPLASEPWLELSSVEGETHAPRAVVVGKGVAFKTPEACPACWKALAKTLAPFDVGPSLGLALGALAALTVQRLILGLEPRALGFLRVGEAGFEAAHPGACCHQMK
jgi:molybdopterin-synthase adenylyltransferase